MKGIISNHSAALTKYQRQTAIDPVAAPQIPVQRQSDGAAGSVAAAQVSISAQARELASGPGVMNTQKIDALRQAIQSGTLEFNSSAIAEKMIDQGE